MHLPDPAAGTTPPVRPSVVVDVGDGDVRRQAEQVAAGAGITVVHPDQVLGHPAPQALALALVDGRRPPPAAQGRQLPVILVADRADPEVWERAARVRAESVVPLPAGRDLLQLRLATLEPAEAATGQLLVVVGARGGCGATTLAVGLARAALSRGLTVLADGDASGPGIDLSLGLEADPGLRWNDVAGVRDILPRSALGGRLLSRDGLDILSYRRPADLASAWLPLVHSLRRSHEYVIGDLPRYQLQPPLGGPATATVIVTGLDLVGITAARSLLAQGDVGRSPIVALRPGKGPMSLKSGLTALAGATVVELPTSRRIAGAADFGDLAAAVSVGAYARCCAAILDRAGL